ncbi:MAG: cytidine deaminase [Psychromonas sp.]
MNIEEQLFKAAAELVNSRYPISWGGAAAIRTESGKILTSVAPDIKVESLGLCMEVGAYLEAHKLNEAVTHSLCIAREDENSDFKVLSPCGVCRERLIHWGGDVMAAISSTNDELVFKSIRELMPDHWSLAFGEKL